MGYNGYTEKKKASNARYAQKQDIFNVRFQTGQRARILEYIEKSGESLNQFIVTAIEERLNK